MSKVLPSVKTYADEPVQYPALTVVDIHAEQRVVTGGYRNAVLQRVNTHCLRLAIFNGEYRWHRHPASDELFVVVEGRLEIELAGGETFALAAWQAITIPAGTVHRTRAVGRTVNLTFEILGAQTEFVD